MSNDDDCQTWIKEVMSKIIENLGLNEARYELSTSNNFVMSSQYHVCVKFKNTIKDKNEELSMILKRSFSCCLNEIFYNDLNLSSQFHNEILFYRMYAQPNDNFPKCFYFDERPPNDSVIALENVNKRGYYPCSYKYYAPLEYTLAAMRELGRFHGKGYVMKEQQRDKFNDIVKQIEEIRYFENATSGFRINVDVNSTRAVEYLRDHGYDVVFCDKMEPVLSNLYDVLVKLVQPLEPLSTFCHGDFTLANMLFKMEDDGQHRVMLIDFASLRYGPPVIDISTYLFLNCSNEVRKDKFHEIMRAYFDALKEYLLDAGIRDIEKYSYDALLHDFRRGAILGYSIASFYLAVLMGYRDFDMTTLSTEENAMMQKNLGGDKVSKILADMLLHLKDLGCLEDYL
ncbi:uncharacterized protein LOC109852657 [Pseudomyrmex gracilis]|uniref:uncharacterized protein LOC109852657 n=1 Tax=Pseudomyrmex gracilis TaxID=219809 RepID=UPI000994DE25|nr:uncharacterized protein LOC109852657 [Pseudomyrmex gracilis]